MNITQFRLSNGPNSFFAYRFFSFDISVLNFHSKTKMYGDDPRCKVCRATCDRQGYNTHRSCGSCQQFYNRSVRMMQR